MDVHTNLFICIFQLHLHTLNISEIVEEIEQFRADVSKCINTFSSPLTAQNKLFHRQKTVQNYSIPSTYDGMTILYLN